MAEKHITGVKITQENLIKAGDEFYDTVYKRLIKIALIDGESKAKQGCGVDTGRLRASIHTEYWDDRVQFESQDGGFQGGVYKDNRGNSYEGKLSDNPSEGEVYFGTNVEYAPNHENDRGFMDKAAKNVRDAMKTKKLTGKINFIKCKMT